MLENAIALGEARVRLCANPPKSPVCEDEQVQLVDWTHSPDCGFWKCRICKHQFVTKNDTATTDENATSGGRG